MSRIELPASDELDRLKLISQEYAPHIGGAARAYSIAVYQHSSLSIREMEAARYRTAQINGCKVCQQFRGAIDIDLYLESSGSTPSVVARGAAPDEAFYASIREWTKSTVYSARERIAIDLAERMGERPQSMEGDEKFWTQVHSCYSDAEIVDLTLSIASWIALGRVAHTLELDDVCLPAARSRKGETALEHAHG